MSAGARRDFRLCLDDPGVLGEREGPDLHSREGTALCAPPAARGCMRGLTWPSRDGHGRVTLAAALALLVMCAGSARAADDAETDRPDVSTSTSTVLPTALQIETGLAYARTRLAGAPADRRFSLEATARFGLTERLEARVDAEPFVRLRDGDQDTGSGDYTFALKYRAWEPPTDSILPKLGVLPFVKAGVADPPIGTGKPDFGLIALAGFQFPADFALDVNAGIAALGQRDGGYLAQAQASASLSRPLTRRLTAFGELFFFSQASRDARDSVGADAGVIFRVSRDVLLDASITTSLSGVLPDYVLRTGVTMRFGR
jgi:outer membrane putative beta-barrel porin/alpha-amylase